MRRKIVAGNWKMNLDLNSSAELVQSILGQITPAKCDVLFCPPYPFLYSVNELIKDRANVYLGGQNLSKHDKGAFTGEVSAGMLQSVGCQYVLIGHSECREHFHEIDESLVGKIHQAFKYNLTPIFCCGESLKDRELNAYADFVALQIREALFELSEDQLSRMIIAYEPIWAIGTGHTASPEQAQEMHSIIRGILKERFSESVVDNLPILYGGSVNAGNARELFSQLDVDGGLVGGASLKADEFVSIIRAMEEML